MANQQHMALVFCMSPCFHMNLGHQRAGGVYSDHIPPIRLLDNSAGNPVGREYNRRPFGNLIKFLDENRTHTRQPVDNCTVVNDFVAHIDWRAEFLQRDLDDADRTIDAGTKAARRGQVQVFALLCHAVVLA